MLLYTPVYLRLWLLGRRKGILEVVQNVLLQWAIGVNPTEGVRATAPPDNT